ncbi:MAG TPA: DUF1801 domain-containing protein [Ensifer sp.]|jgi:hypothetical protein|uniref:DUF1801 domain-containing protein n=1 Tax=Ensifer sp. TaxID=1872086 RepID=UPI002E141E8D|nr:DUF1801 domain-containing protein [Ensifer sp.]
MMRSARRLPPMPADVAKAFARWPEPARAQLLTVRQLIFSTAAETPCVGELTETLKWGEPAYLTEATGSGSTIRLGISKSPGGEGAVLFNCHTTLAAAFRVQFSEFAYQGNRAILLDPARTVPTAQLAICLAMALTYHRKRVG